MIEVTLRPAAREEEIRAARVSKKRALAVPALYEFLQAGIAALAEYSAMEVLARRRSAGGFVIPEVS